MKLISLFSVATAGGLRRPCLQQRRGCFPRLYPAKDWGNLGASIFHSMQFIGASLHSMLKYSLPHYSNWSFVLFNIIDPSCCSFILHGSRSASTTPRFCHLCVQQRWNCQLFHCRIFHWWRTNLYLHKCIPSFFSFSWSILGYTKSSTN